MELLLITIIVLLVILYLPYLFKTFGLKEIKRSDIPAEGEWAHISDGNIFYRWFHPEIEHRKEEIVILVHGFSTPSFVWGGVIDNFSPVYKSLKDFLNFSISVISASSC